MQVMAFGAIALFGVVAAANAADTTLIREFAKNKPRVFILASGPQAMSVGETIKSAILRHPDNKHSAQDISVLSFTDAVAASKQPDFAKSPVIFLMDRQEMTQPMPQELEALIPKPALGSLGYNSNITAALGGARDQQVFTVAISAPDTARLGKLYDAFTTRSAAGFRDLPFSENWTTNRLNVFSDHSNRELAENWGYVKTAYVWNDVTWHDLTEYSSVPASSLQEGSSVFFIDRSQGDVTPAPASNLLAGHKVTPTLIAVERFGGDAQGNAGVIVFSAPNTTILERKAIRYSTRESVPAGDTAVDAVDMRKLGAMTILVGGDIPERNRQPIRYMMASHMRRDLGLAVSERGRGQQDFQRDISLDQVRGQGDVARSLRDTGAHFVWHYSINRYGGHTDYDSQIKRITPLPKPFDETEPTEPSHGRDLFGHKMSDDEYAKAMDKYKKDHREWRRKKEGYDVTVALMSFKWQQDVLEKQSAHMRGILRLIDISAQGGGRIVWEQDCEGNQDAGSVAETKEVEVCGPDAIPAKLPTPPPVDEAADDVMRGALENAGSDLFDDIRETALLPDPTSDATTKDDTPAPPAPVAKSGQVADIQNGVVTITIGTAQGIQPGDTIRVVLSKRDIHDPNTGAVIDTRVLDSLNLRIIQLGVTTDCVPATSADTAKLSKVIVGMMVQIVTH